MITDEIRQSLFALQDIKYRDFQAKLIPTNAAESVIGVRTPALRKLARELRKDPKIGDFLQDLPHTFFDENQLHAFLISEIKDYTECLVQVQRFLPYIDNWATCDLISPKIFRKHTEELMPYIKKWMASEHTYTCRFGIKMLMTYFLDNNFRSEYAEWVAAVKSEEYYVNMMIAWYFATALAKQYDTAVQYLQTQKLDVWTHNKTIQKAIESYRITDEQKRYLKTLKQK